MGYFGGGYLTFLYSEVGETGGEMMKKLGQDVDKKIFFVIMSLYNLNWYSEGDICSYGGPDQHPSTYYIHCQCSVGIQQSVAAAYAHFF